MLKHLSQRSESRNSNLDDFLFDTSEDQEEKQDEEQNQDTQVKNDISETNNQEVLENKDNVDGISILLTKPTIKRIIERRRSELFLKDNIQNTIKEGIAEDEKPKENTEPESPKETIEEVQKETKKLVIHRRKKEPSLDSSSEESGISSQVSETNNNKNNQDEEALQPASSQKDFWKLEVEVPPQPAPVAFSSPAVDTFKERLHYRSQDYLNSTQKTETPVKQTHGYSTLDGRVRNKQKHNQTATINRLDSLRLQKRNLELELLRERETRSDYHPSPSRHSYTMDRRHHRHTGSNSDYLNELPRQQRVQRPHSVGADMLRHHTYNPQSNTLLIPAQSAGLNKVLHKNSLKHFNRNDKHRASAYSVSAGSSVSNIRPQTARSVGLESSVSNIIPNGSNRDCAWATLNRQGILEKINEEIEHENKLNEATVLRNNVATQRCKYLVIFLIIFTVLSCSIAGMLLFFVGHFPRTIMLNQGDVQLIDVSSTWCSGIEVMSKQSSVRAITFSNKEARANSTHYKREERFVIEAKSVWWRSFYILQGSNLRFTISTLQPVDILTFENVHQYEMWLERKESKTYIEKKECCQNTPKGYQEIEIHAKTDASHVIAIHRQGSFAEEVEVTMIAYRFTYDFTSTSDSCTAQKSQACSVEYDFNSDDNIAIEIPLDRTLANRITEASEIEWQCTARSWFYFIIFFTIFLFISVLLLFLYVLFSRSSANTHDKLCCMQNKRNKSFTVDYYDNFGRTNSDIGAAESQQTTSNSAKYLIDSKSSATLKPIYGDSSTISESSRYLANLFRKSSTMPRLTRHPSRMDDALNKDHCSGSVAAIYKETSNYEEKADSGISIDPNLSPPGQNNMNPRDYQREMQLEHFKQLRHHEIQGMELINGPSVRDLLYRPKSELTRPVPYDLNENDIPYNLLKYRQEMNNRGFHSNYDLNFDYPRVPPARAQSVIGNGDYYRYNSYHDNNNKRIQNGSTKQLQHEGYEIPYNEDIYL